MREIGAAHSEDHVAEGIRMIAVGRCLHWRAGRDSEGKHQWWSNEIVGSGKSCSGRVLARGDRDRMREVGADLQRDFGHGPELPAL